MEDIKFSSAIESQESPENSTKNVDEFEKLPEFNEIHAKFVFTEEQASLLFLCDIPS